MKKNVYIKILCLLMVVVMLLSSCKKDPVVTNEPTETGGTAVSPTSSADSGPTNGIRTVDGRFAESPLLNDKVLGGTLPPLEERIPLEPAVFNDIPEGELDIQQGWYGGRIRTTIVNEMMREQMLNIPGMVYNSDKITGNVLKDYKMEDDGKVFTFYMREGMKWADGNPCTSEDVRFHWEDYILNEELNPGGVPARFKTASGPMELKIINEYEYQYIFKDTNPGILIELTTRMQGYGSFIMPSAFYKQYHANYVDSRTMQQMLDKEGIESWARLFALRMDAAEDDYTYVTAPTLEPWVMKRKTTTDLLFVRNPYYYKVDSWGNQLPYVDELSVQLLTNGEMNNMKLFAGEIDFMRTDSSVKPLYARYQEEGNYRMLFLPGNASVSDIYLNLTYEDDVWRQVVRDKRFRQAIDAAINRQIIIDAAKHGEATPPTITPAVYDVDLANRLLDEMGLDKRDSSGYRLGPDGKRFTIPFDYGTYIAGEWELVLALVIEDLKHVGIEATMKLMSEALYVERSTANLIQASMCWSHPGLWPYVLPDWQPVHTQGLHNNLWCPLWRQWFDSNGERGEEPPADMKELYECYRIMTTSFDGSEQEAAWARAQELWHENVYYIPTCGSVMEVQVVTNRLHNVLETDLLLLSNFAGEILYYIP